MPARNPHPFATASTAELIASSLVIKPTMSDEKKPAASAWTEQEKVHFLHPFSPLSLNTTANACQMSLIMQIAALTQPVPWKELDLPAGRTEKACVVMYDKEKAKYKKAKGDSADGEGDEPATPATAAKAKGKVSSFIL